VIARYVLVMLVMATRPPDNALFPRTEETISMSGRPTAFGGMKVPLIDERDRLSTTAA
jgi:hypothetical protein